MKKFFTNLTFATGLVFVLTITSFIIAQTGALALAIVPIILLALILLVMIIRDPSLGFLMIIFFLPFERVPTYEVGGINIKINTILGFVTIIAWVLALLFNGKKYKVQPNALSIPLCVFVLALLVSLTQALNFTRAAAVLFFVIFTVVLSVLTVNMVKDMESLKKTVAVLFASSILVGIFSFFQFGGDVVGLPRSITLLKQGYDSKVFGFPRVQAFSMEPLYLANYLLIPLSLSFSYFLAQIKAGDLGENSLITKRWFVVALSALLLVIFILTVSRGGYLGLIATFAIFMLFYFKRIFTWRNITIGLVTVAIVISGVFYALSKGEYRATEEFIGHVTLNDMNKGESVQGRLATFKFALGAYKWNPNFGIGIGNYGPYAKNYPPVAPKTGWDIVNNQYIEVLVETGLFGLASFLLILLILTIRSLAAIRYCQDPFVKATLIGLLAAFVGVLVQYNFFSTLYIIHIWVLIGLLVAVQTMALKSKKYKVQSEKYKTNSGSLEYGNLNLK